MLSNYGWITWEGKLRTNIVLQVDGTVVIFDIETNGVARKLQGHTRQIQSIRSYIWSLHERQC